MIPVFIFGFIFDWFAFIDFVPPNEDIPVGIIASNCFGVFERYFAGFDCYLSFIEHPVLDKSVPLTFRIGDFYFPSIPTDPINYDGFGKVTNFLELGL
jgi:hypothetical protein